MLPLTGLRQIPIVGGAQLRFSAADRGRITPRTSTHRRRLTRPSSSDHLSHISIGMPGPRKRTLIAITAIVVGVPLAIVARYWIYILGAGRLWDKAEKEVHLLPAGFIGPVVILLSDSDAAPTVRENGARLFRIPASGVTRSRFGVNYGWGRPDYYYVDSQAPRTRVVSGTPCDDSLPGDPVQACLMGHTSFGDLPDRPYQAYVVGRRADQLRWKWRADRFVDSVVYGRPYP